MESGNLLSQDTSNRLQKEWLATMIGHLIGLEKVVCALKALRYHLPLLSLLSLAILSFKKENQNEENLINLKANQKKERLESVC